MPCHPMSASVEWSPPAADGVHPAADEERAGRGDPLDAGGRVVEEAVGVRARVLQLAGEVPVHGEHRHGEGGEPAGEGGIAPGEERLVDVLRVERREDSRAARVLRRSGPASQGHHLHGGEREQRDKGARRSSWCHSVSPQVSRFFANR